MSAELDPTAPRTDPKTRVPLSIERVVLAACMAGMTLITGANVVTRYFSNISLAFTEEYSMLLMVVATFVGSAYAFAAGRHVRIDYFIGLLGPKGRRNAEILSLCLVIAIFAVIVVFGAKLSWDSYRFDVQTAGMGHPEWIFVATLPVFGLALIGRAIGRIVRLVKGTEIAS